MNGETMPIWEVRIKFGSDIFRLLGFFDGSQLVVLNYAFKKKPKKFLARLFKLLKNENVII
ncbi:MAG: type II toxin-antitoxin system RelE/ParE family toxin [Desulfosarcina sp.]|nr:type II toxin-antitoxin system RelE/ParE family toxin [Desulfobacterales bacterium]